MIDVPGYSELPPRIQAAITLRMSGLTYREIGESLGRVQTGAGCHLPPGPITAERARQIVEKGRRMLRHPSRRYHPDSPWAVPSKSNKLVFSHFSSSDPGVIRNDGVWRMGQSRIVDGTFEWFKVQDPLTGRYRVCQRSTSCAGDVWTIIDQPIPSHIEEQAVV